jgi:hypothetical protein
MKLITIISIYRSHNPGVGAPSLPPVTRLHIPSRRALQGAQAWSRATRSYQICGYPSRPWRVSVLDNFYDKARTCNAFEDFLKLLNFYWARRTGQDAQSGATMRRLLKSRVVAA